MPGLAAKPPAPYSAPNHAHEDHVSSGRVFHLLDRLFLQERARTAHSNQPSTHTPTVRTAGAGAGATVTAYTL